MSDLEFTSEDMAAMGREGTRKDFILMLRRPSAGARTSTGQGVSSRMPAAHIPGAWPVGTNNDAPGAKTCPCEACARHAEGAPSRPAGTNP
jgi:hypothetical protein